MRHISMDRLAALVFAAALSLPTSTFANAQESMPPGQVTQFKDTSMLKLPAGAHAAIFDFEDLECPACSHAFPITHQAIDHYKIPLLRHDFLIQGHRWSRIAAINARYLQDKVSFPTSEQYRKDVFASQITLSSRDDLDSFTRKWFQTHNLQMPFVMDPNGLFAAEVEQDVNLGVRLGVHETPTIIVLAPHGWIQVKDITQLYSAIDAALAQTPSKPAVHKVAAKH